MQPDKGTLLQPAPVDQNYGGIKAYMVVLTEAQNVSNVSDTILYLTDLYHAAQNIIEDKPFLLLAACFYIDALALRGHNEGSDKDFAGLLQSILKTCRIEGDKCREKSGWEGLNDAIDVIYNYHNPSEQSHSRTPQTRQHSILPSLVNPNGHDNV
jgi:hypothetical protein